MCSMLVPAGRQSVVPPQALADRGYHDRSTPHLPWPPDAARCRAFYSSIMRPDLPYALGATVLGVFLLGNAALAPDAGTVRAIDVALAVATAAALAVCRRYPVIALSVTTAAMLAFHFRVHAGVSAAFAVLAAVYVAAWRGHRWAARASAPRRWGGGVR